MGLNIVINDREGVSGFAQGGIYRESVIYTSDADIPTGSYLIIRPALFMKDLIVKPTEWNQNVNQPVDYYWVHVWNAVAGEYNCTPNFNIKYRNIIISVKQFTARSFEIKLEWLAIADINKHIYPHTYQPLALWENPNVDKVPYSVYNNSGEQISLRLNIFDPNTGEHLINEPYVIQSDNPVQGIAWDQFSNPNIPNVCYFEIDGEPSDGYRIGSDLTVKLRGFPRYTNTQYFAGIYRVDKLLNQNAPFYDEIYMQMAKANNTAAEPFALTSGIIDKNYLKDMHVFRYDHLESIADFTIDKDYFESGGQYKIFVVAKESCQFKSYLSDVFSEQSTWDNPEGDFAIASVKVDGIDIDIEAGTCLYNIPYGSEVSFKAEFDKDTFENDLALKSLPGTFADYYREAECFISDSPQKLGSPVLGEVITDELIGSKQTTTYTFKIPESWQGLTKYVNIGWIFDYNGIQTDHIIGFIVINFANKPDAISLSQPLGLPEEVCDNEIGNTDFCFTADDSTPDHKFFVDTFLEGNLIDDDSNIITKTDDDFSTNSDACLNFKYDNIKNNEQYCFNLRAWTPELNESDRPCTTIRLYKNLNTTNPALKVFDFGYELIGWTDADVKFVGIIISDQNDVPVYDFFSTNLAANSVFTKELFNVVSLYRLSIYILDANGNTYYASPVIFYMSNERGDNEMTIEICTGVKKQDCEHNPALSATVVWNYVAPPIYGSLLNKTITAVETDLGSYDNIEKYKIINGTETAYTGAFTTAPFNVVALRYIITYEGCDPIELYYCITEQEPSIP